MIQIIAAVDKNWGIGKGNKLLLSIPADMAYFRKLTEGNVIIMGRKTLESFPAGKPLPNRINIVITRDKSYNNKDVIVVASPEQALATASEYNREVFIIGGESIYEQMLDMADVCHITYIDYSYVADKHFPNLDKKDNWVLSGESEEQTHYDICYYFRKYEKKA